MSMACGYEYSIQFDTWHVALSQHSKFSQYTYRMYMKISSLGIFGTSVTMGDHIQTAAIKFSPSDARLNIFSHFTPLPPVPEAPRPNREPSPCRTNYDKVLRIPQKKAQVTSH